MYAEIRNFFTNNNGSIGPIFAIAITPVLIAAGAAIDYSRASNVSAAAQSYLDAAAFAAATSDIKSKNKRKKVAIEFFQSQVASNNNFPDGAWKPKIDISDSEISGSVDIELPTTILLLAGIKTIKIKAYSEVSLGADTLGDSCIYAKTVKVSGSLRIDPYCGFHVQDTSNRAFDVWGSFANHNTKVTSAGGFVGSAAFNAVKVNQELQSYSDPLSSQSSIQVNNCKDNGQSVSVSSGKKTIVAGTYCKKWTLDGGELHLSAGTYILEEPIEVNRGTVITGDNTTIVFTKNARFNINTNSTGEGLDYYATPPAAGAFKDILIYQAPSAADNLNYVFGSLDFTEGFHGIVYMPEMDMDITGAFAFKTLKHAGLVVRNFKITGAAHFHVPDQEASTLLAGTSTQPYLKK